MQTDQGGRRVAEGNGGLGQHGRAELADVGVRWRRQAQQLAQALVDERHLLVFVGSQQSRGRGLEQGRGLPGGGLALLAELLAQGRQLGVRGGLGVPRLPKLPVQMAIPD